MVNWRKQLLGAALPIALPLILFATKAEAGTLNQLQLNTTTNRLILNVSEATRPEAFLLFNPQRIVIDLPNTTRGSIPATRSYGKGIKEVRVGQFTATTTRIVVELAAGHIIDPQKTVLRRVSGNNWEINLDCIVALPQPNARSVAIPVPTPGGATTTPVPAPTPAPTPTPTPAPAPTPTPTPTPPTSSQPINRNFCRSRTNTALSAILNKNARASWGVMVQETGKDVLFERNAGMLLAPASNNKLFTTAATLSKFGPDYRIKTPVLGSSSGAVVDQLRIVGQGDPSLKTADLTRLAQQLKARGVQRVGLLVGDDTRFRGPSLNPNWDATDIGQAYAAPVNSLIVNENIIGLILSPSRQGQRLNVTWEDPTDQVFWTLDNRSVTAARTGSESVNLVPSGNRIVITGQLREGSAPEPVGVAIANEGNYLVRKFSDALKQAGIQVDGVTRVTQTSAPASFVELASVQSAPLSELLKPANLESNNLYAEAFLKILGSDRLPNALDTRISGVAAIADLLGRQGVDTRQLRMVDGSGLAANNRASARALVQTLQFVAGGRNAEVFRNSLAVAGRSGTLEKRLVGTPAQNRVFAKTGTISNVVSLAGYITPSNHPPLTFAILVNSSSSPAEIRALVDEMVIFLAQLESRC